MTYLVWYQNQNRIMLWRDNIILYNSTAVDKYSKRNENKITTHTKKKTQHIRLCIALLSTIILLQLITIIYLKNDKNFECKIYKIWNLENLND